MNWIETVFCSSFVFEYIWKCSWCSDLYFECINGSCGSNSGCSDALYFFRILNLGEGSSSAVSHQLQPTGGLYFRTWAVWVRGGQRKLYSGIRKNSFQRRLAMTDTSRRLLRDSAQRWEFHRWVAAFVFLACLRSVVCSNVTTRHCSGKCESSVRCAHPWNIREVKPPRQHRRGGVRITLLYVN